MQKTTWLALAVLALPASVAVAGPPAPAVPAAASSPAEASRPYTPGLDVTAMDRTADPCANFYQYACGGWRKNNPIPPDQTSWSVYGKLYEDNLAFLRGILEEAGRTRRDAVEERIGDYYAACMDEAAVEKLGLAPLQGDLDAIAALRSVRDLPALLARLQVDTGARGMLFGVGSAQDPDDSERVILNLDQGGLGLPDRDYYTKDDPRSREIRDRYLQHVERVFALLGEGPEAAKAHAAAVMELETGLARASLTRVERRDPYRLKNKYARADMPKVAASLDWEAYFRALGAPPFEVANVMAPAFFAEIEARLSSTPLATWQAYLRLHLAEAAAPYLSSPFVSEQFGFYRRYLRGAQEMAPRWKRCVQYVDRDLGEALGQAYVRRVFPPETRRATLAMVEQVEAAMQERIEGLDWMGAATKRKALEKLHGIRNKVGYPDRWRDYSPVQVSRAAFLASVRSAVSFESRRGLRKIGRPLDRDEWAMSPPTVNAYYDPQMNDINFPAGILQPPLYDPRMDDAPNYGNTGGTIGHELTHGFDDEGRKFDARGNLKDWWTEEDAREFERRTQCIRDQYAKYVAVDDIHVNSALTAGEDVADLGGEILAWMAWKAATADRKLEPRDGLSPEQRFFVGFAQWVCANQRPEEQRVRAATDPHSPPEPRVNGVVVNMPEFARAFSCKPGQAMVKPPEEVCRVW